MLKPKMLCSGSVVATAVVVLLLAVSSSDAQAPGKVKTVTVAVAVDDEAQGYEGVRAMDGNRDSMWHTKWGPGEKAQPHQIVIDLGQPYALRGFVYTSRRASLNGSIKDYECFVSATPEVTGQPTARGAFKAAPGEPQEVMFETPVTGRCLVLRALSEQLGRAWTSIAELDILSDGVRFRADVSKLPPAPGTVAEHVLKPGEVMPSADGSVASVLDLAKRTLAFVERSEKRPALAAELAALERQLAAAADKDALLTPLRGLRRRIILSHPALDFDRLLINKRPPPKFLHQSDQYLGRYSGVGSGLVVLDSWKDSPAATVLLDGKLPAGSVLHPDLSFDGTRILFCFCDHTEQRAAHRRFFIYEIGVDGTGLRQLTGTAKDPLAGFAGRQTVLIEDFDPCYLPDGGIAFVSTRNQGGVRCHHGGRYCPTYTLYRMHGDGSSIRPMAYAEANEWDPSILPDGRIIWTRWDYINRHDTVFQSLWTTRPDGTATAHFYGNYTRNPCVLAEARAIPGSHKVVATASAHHMYTAGSIVVVDPHAGQDGDEPLFRVTPETTFPETDQPRWPSTAYAGPWPFTDELFLVAYSPEYRPKAQNSYAIYLVDTLGGRELIYRDPASSCFTPIPVRPRAEPPAIASMLPAAGAAPTGVFYVKNVYASSQPIPSGAAAKLRVVEILQQPVQRVPDRSVTLFELPKKILGTAPVSGDGSVAFEAPAGVPLLFQLVDANEMCVMSMRTLVYLHPGETQSCAGCHEPRKRTPSSDFSIPAVPVHKLTPPVGPHDGEGLSFARTVQPVLDRHCIRCHGLSEKPAGGVNLLGTMDTQPLKLGRIRASVAYSSLVHREGLVAVAYRNRETPVSKPKDYFSHAGRLARMLLQGEKGHGKLDRESFLRIVYWLDLNAQFYGSYSWNKDEWRAAIPAGEKALRAHVAECFGKDLAAQPFAALVNVALPEASRILKAPLALAAGGWGQIPGGWDGREDAGYVRMQQLVSAAISALEHHDVAATCAQPACECRGCWVRSAEAEYREKLAQAQQASTGVTARKPD